MDTTTLDIKLDRQIGDRLMALGQCKDRATHWIFATGSMRTEKW